MIPCEFGYKILILETLHLTLFKPKLFLTFQKQNQNNINSFYTREATNEVAYL